MNYAVHLKEGIYRVTGDELKARPKGLVTTIIQLRIHTASSSYTWYTNGIFIAVNGKDRTYIANAKTTCVENTHSHTTPEYIIKLLTK